MYHLSVLNELATSQGAVTTKRKKTQLEPVPQFPQCAPPRPKTEKTTHTNTHTHCHADNRTTKITLISSTAV